MTHLRRRKTPIRSAGQCKHCWLHALLQYFRSALICVLIAVQGPAAAHAPSAAQGPAASRQQDLHKAKAIAMSAYRESLAAERAAGPANAPAPAGGPAAAQHQVTLAAKAIAMAAYEAEALASDMGPSPARAPAPASTGGILSSY